MRVVALIVLASGCGRLAFEPLAASADARTDDAELDASACTWSAFSAPVRLPGDVMTGLDEWMGTPFLGETQLMFHRYATTNSDLFVASRISRTAPFSGVTTVTELSSASDDWTPTLTEDGLDIIFARLTGTFELMSATRASTGVTFSAPSPLVGLNTTTHDNSPWLSADGLRLLYTSGLSSARRIYETTRPARTMTFGAPSELDLGGSAMDPTLSADGLELVFISDRAGGEGGTDVWTARRPAIDQPFAAPLHVPELSSMRDETGLRLSLDGATMYLNFDTLLIGGGAADIYTATRSCL